MPTYTSMLNWTAEPLPRPADIRTAVLADGARLAASIHPHAATRIESMRSDDDPAEPDGTREVVCPPPPANT